MSDDPRPYHKPVRRPAELFDRLFAAEDPAEVSRVAHSTAQALLSRVRANPDEAVVDRLIAFTAEHGIDDIAELWSRSPAKTLPGALWRLYLVQLMIHDDPSTAALTYERGRAALDTADALIAGAPVPASPDELVTLVDTILRGLFRGDFAVALDRAAAFCRVQAAGATYLADDYDATESDRSAAFTTRALRLSDYASDLRLRGPLAPRIPHLIKGRSARPRSPPRYPAPASWREPTSSVASPQVSGVGCCGLARKGVGSAPPSRSAGRSRSAPDLGILPWHRGANPHHWSRTQRFRALNAVGSRVSVWVRHSERAGSATWGWAREDGVAADLQATQTRKCRAAERLSARGRS